MKLSKKTRILTIFSLITIITMLTIFSVITDTTNCIIYFIIIVLLLFLTFIILLFYNNALLKYKVYLSIIKSLQGLKKIKEIQYKLNFTGSTKDVEACDKMIDEYQDFILAFNNENILNFFGKRQKDKIINVINKVKEYDNN